MTAPQTLIFSITFLIMSLLVNVFLFFDQTKLKNKFDSQSLALSQVEQELEQSLNFKTEQLAKLSAMGGQQSELADFVKELQKEIVKLSEDYKLSNVTAEQTKTQLKSAQQKISQLAQQNSKLTDDQNKLIQQLAQADITIKNQQRAIKNAATAGSASEDQQATLSVLTSALTPNFADITVAQASNGDVTVNIPLELIFSDTMTFTDQAETIFDPIIKQIQSLPTADVTIVGHSDARPITSDLAERYPTNWELSSVRASKVVNFFNQRGIPEEQLVAAGKASNQPVRDESNSVAWAINRRIEIRIH